VAQGVDDWPAVLAALVIGDVPTAFLGCLGKIRFALRAACHRGWVVTMIGSGFSQGRFQIYAQKVGAGNCTPDLWQPAELVSRAR